jgi:hypothetical protein
VWECARSHTQIVSNENYKLLTPSCRQSSMPVRVRMSAPGWPVRAPVGEWPTPTHWELLGLQRRRPGLDGFTAKKGEAKGRVKYITYNKRARRSARSADERRRGRGQQLRPAALCAARAARAG